MLVQWLAPHNDKPLGLNLLLGCFLEMYRYKDLILILANVQFDDCNQSINKKENNS